MTAGMPPRERGQAAVESAITLPTVIFTVLGILQLTLVHQARMMLEYAAFSAARAGAVWNGDPAKMQSAAMLALMPTMPSLPLDSAVTPCPEGMRVDKVGQLFCRWTLLDEANRRLPVTGALAPFGPGKRLVTVETLSPTKQDFGDEKELDFDQGGDSLAERQKSQLTLRLTYFYELRIPIVNWMFFETWLAGAGGIGLSGLEVAEPRMRLGGGNASVSDASIRMGIEASQVDSNCAFSGLTRAHVTRLLALGTGSSRLLGSAKWYIPLVTTYTIRMQSNPFLQFAGEPPARCDSTSR